MAKINKKTVDAVKKLNEQLFEAEYKLETQQRAVSKYRYYLAAEPTAEKVMDLRGAMANLRAYQQQADKLRRQLEEALNNVWGDPAL